MAYNLDTTSLEYAENGLYGFARIAPSETLTAAAGAFCFVLAVGGDVSFGDGTVLVHGDRTRTDAPDPADVIAQGQTVAVYATTIENDGPGVMWAYYDRLQPESA